MNQKLLAAIIVIAIAALIVGGVVAATVYSQNIAWNYQATAESFTVNQPISLDLGTIIGTQTFRVNYTVVNDGNVPITVSANAAPTGSVSPGWNSTQATLSVGGNTTFQLTLVISGAGSCAVTIVKV